MRKIYRYRDLSFDVANDTEVKFTVKFISDGNEGQTLINVPGTTDPEIENSGTIVIGKGVDLREGTTISVSDVANLIPEEDEIRIRFEINGRLLIEHVNSKSEEERPIIILFIKFPQP